MADYDIWNGKQLNSSNVRMLEDACRELDEWVEKEKKEKGYLDSGLWLKKVYEVLGISPTEQLEIEYKTMTNSTKSSAKIES